MQSRPDLPRRLSAREQRVEAASAALFLVAACAVALALEPARDTDIGLLAGLVAFHAAASRIRLYIGAGFSMPTEVPLLVMLFTLPPGLVPLTVAAGLLLAHSVEIARRRTHPERALCAIGDAWHSLPPALVFAAAGTPAAEVDAAPLLLAALAAQCAGDVAASTLREWAGRGILPGLQLRAMAWVCAIDAALAPLGLLAAIATAETRAGWLLAVPPVLLLAGLARDRRRRIEEAVEGARDLQRERERLQEVLRGAGRAFASNLDRDGLQRAIADIAAEALAAEVGWIGTHLHADAGAPLAGGDEILATAARAAVEQARAEPGVAVLSAEEWHVLACSLRGRRAAPETILVARRGDPFAADDLKLLGHLAAQAGISMENADLHERTRKQAAVDDLTGLSNHRHLQEFLDAQIATGMPLALILADIDDFKAVNDTLGHQQGDLVLRRVGAVVRACFREADEMARYGGEELAIAIPGATLEDARAAAERLRADVERLRVRVSGTGRIGVTISVGVAAFPSCAADKQTLVAAADAALYRAKAGGKNRVDVAPATRPLTPA